MLDWLKRVFEKFSFTDEESDNERRHPVLSERSLSYCYKTLSEYARSENHESVILKEEFHEIYFVEGKFEVTLILLSSPEGKTIVSCHVLASRRGKSRQKLYETLETVNGLLNQ